MLGFSSELGEFKQIMKQNAVFVSFDCKTAKDSKNQNKQTNLCGFRLLG